MNCVLDSLIYPHTSYIKLNQQQTLINVYIDIYKLHKEEAT